MALGRKDNANNRANMQSSALEGSVSMLHVLFYTVISLSLRRGQPWFGQTACTFVSQLILPEMYAVFGWVTKAYLLNHRLKASLFVKGVFQHAGLPCPAVVVKHAASMTNLED